MTFQISPKCLYMAGKLCTIFFLVCLFVQPSHSQTVSKKRTTTITRKDYVKYGVASYYARKFEGRRTASGEKYTGAKYTAACNVLPLRTWIKVTNLRNKKTVVVRVNDRLHYKNPRLVDLSYAAAKQLAFTGHGVVRVKVEVLKNYKPPKK